MKSFIKALKSFAAAKDGATAIEYALLAGLISVVIVTAVTGVGTGIDAVFDGVVAAL
ncbi:Flp family type IVb pilin [Hyphomonas sp.]|uniref:Flp family type IVb pilin n=1 Tax=Hyphomonas sp. TaxID=87 RepID=UPI003340613C